MSMQKLRPAGGSTPNGPVKSSHNSAKSSLANLNATSRTVKFTDAQKRALVAVVRRRRSGATLQELADYVSVGRLDAAHLYARFTYQIFRGELIFREVAR
jgi:hypothetical protein